MLTAAQAGLSSTKAGAHQPFSFHLMLYLGVYLHVHYLKISPLPAHLWHVQPGLADSQLVDGPGTVDVPKDSLQLSKLNPGRAVFRCKLQEFFIQLSATVKFTQL